MVVFTPGSENDGRLEFTLSFTSTVTWRTRAMGVGEGELQFTSTFSGGGTRGLPRLPASQVEGRRPRLLAPDRRGVTSIHRWRDPAGLTGGSGSTGLTSIRLHLHRWRDRGSGGMGPHHQGEASIRLHLHRWRDRRLIAIVIDSIELLQFASTFTGGGTL